MSKNLTPSQLDSSQIMKRLFSDDNDAIRIEIASGTDFQVDLSAADGDSVNVYANSGSAESAALDHTASGAAIAATSSAGMRSYQLYGEVTAVDSGTTAGDITVRIDISPKDTGTTFYQTSNTLTIPSGSAVGAVVVGSMLQNLIGRRMKATITGNALTGNDAVKFYVIMSSL